MDDHQLLQQFAKDRSQDAFRQLVERNLPMVYSAACRLAGNPHLAQEVAQEVFTTLAQKAHTITSRQVLAGWLYKTTRNLAMHAVRSEQRRQTREKIAVSMQTEEQTNSFDEILEQLEPAMAELEEADHDALVLRYLQDRTLKEVGLQLGLSEDAARMRVNRAMERLRAVFRNRGVTVASAALGSALAASSATAVPVGLTASISAAAIALPAATATLGTITLSTMHWLNTKSVAAIIGAAILAGAGTYYVEQGKMNKLSAEHRALSEEQQRLSSENEALRTAAAAAESELDQLRKNTSELLRLRNEVATYRREREAEKQALAKEAVSEPDRAAQAPIVFPPGSYVSKEQLAFAGFGTPEAGMQSMIWAMMKSDYDNANNTLIPSFQKMQENEAHGRENFEKAQARMAPSFKGVQILARKSLSAEKVELKVKTDISPTSQMPNGTTLISLETMMNVDGEWKLGGSSRPYRQDWEKEGDVQIYAQ